MKCARRPSGSARNVWRTRVTSVHRSADRARVQLADPVPCVAEITMNALGDLALHEGDDVWASVKATELDIHPAPSATK